MGLIQSRDDHRKLSHLLVEENQFIGLEDLHIRGMIANHRFANVNAAINLLTQSTVGAPEHLQCTQVQVSNAWGRL